jgi:hypothetical protein
MKRNPGRRTGSGVMAAALSVLSVQSIGLAHAQATNTGPGQHMPAPDESHGAPTFGSGGWMLHDKAQLALVGASNQATGIFAGIQCDPFDPRSHRLILGAVHTGKSIDAMEAFQNQSMKMMVATNGSSLSAKFEILPEDRGHSDFAGGFIYTASYLNQQQFDALNSAKSFIIKAGGQTYNFSGAGSARAIGAMACHSGEIHVARRLIERRHAIETSQDDRSQQYLGAWQLTYHSGAAALMRGRAEVFANTTNHPANMAASFRLGVSCIDRRFYANLTVGINPALSDDSNLESVNDFIHRFGQHGKLVEIYRGGQRIATFLVARDEFAGKGHELTSQELASMMESDSLAVVGDNKVIEFSTANAAASLASLLRACPKAL